MFQQIIALLIILFFINRLFWQKKKNQIGGAEFILWLSFWLIAGIAIIFIKKIDWLVSNLGFSASGIDILLYISIIVLFYLIYKLRLKLEKTERNITKLVRQIAIDEKK